MRISLLAIGARMPAWVQAGVEEYSRRLRHESELSIIEIPLSKRGSAGNIHRSRQKEGQALLAKVDPIDHVVALEVTGRTLSTPALAKRLQILREESRTLKILIGGPDGLDRSCLDRADECWSLSALTLPHPLVRVVLIEQIYRAFSLLRGHPYHRE